MSNVTEIQVPDMGSFESVAVIDVLVKPGDVIEVAAEGIGTLVNGVVDEA